MTEPWLEPPCGRLVPGKPFPSYRYLPGRAPHPTRDPLGHSYAGGIEPAPRPCPLPDRWRESEAYLYAIDLYNNGFFWEAHEEWELLWRSLTKGTPQHTFLQALIQAAAACLKERQGAEAGARRLAERAARRLGHVAAGASHLMGIDVMAFKARLKAHFEACGAFPFLEVGPWAQ